MTIKRTSLQFVGLIILAVTLLMISSQEVVAQNSSEKPYVEFNYPDTVDYDIIYLADELGFFKDASIRPKYAGKISTGQLVPALVSGDLHLIYRHTPVIVAAIASGADIKTIASGSMSLEAFPHMKYFVRADSDIKSIKDFKDKTLSMNSFGACSEYVTKKYLKDNGIDPASVKMIVAPEEQQEIPLKSKVTDIAIIHPLPSGHAAANKTDFKVLFSDWDIDGGLSGMCPYSINGKFLREHPEEVKELIGIISKAAKWNHEHQEEGRAILAKKFGFKLEEAEIFEYYPDQLIPIDGIQFWIDRLVEENKLKKDQIQATAVFSNEYNPAYKN